VKTLRSPDTTMAGLGVEAVENALSELTLGALESSSRRAETTP
jgi:hypothetical protein